MAPDTMGMVRAEVERTSGERLSWSLSRGDRRISTGLATACMRLDGAGLALHCHQAEVPMLSV